MFQRERANWIRCFATPRKRGGMKMTLIFAKINRVLPNFHELCPENKVKTLLCPSNTKLVNKFIKIILNDRKSLMMDIHFPP